MVFNADRVVSVSNLALRNEFGHNLRPVEFTQLYKSELNGLGLLRVECCPKFIDYHRNGFNVGGLVINHADKLKCEREILLRLRMNLNMILTLCTVYSCRDKQ